MVSRMMMPALLTTTFVAPISRPTRSARLLQASASVTSRENAVASPPSARMSTAVFSAVSDRTSVTMTRAPLRAKPTAMARPLPCPAPVDQHELVLEHNAERYLVSCHGRLLRLCDFAHHDDAVSLDGRSGPGSGGRCGSAHPSRPVAAPAMWHPAIWPKVKAGPRVMPAPG